ncbi:MAG: DUF3618 domain-containing protein [Bryobacteraceae bacterium]|nr:DUF3618 domain-containing protein [Bryobacteraceae bacterium]
MGETTDQIRGEIEAKRAQLGQNLSALERRVKDAADWRKQYEQRPLHAAGIAFGAGLVFALLLGPGGDSRRRRQRVV